MFDNASQAIFTTGGVIYLMIVPLLQMVAKAFMAVSVWKDHKARGYSHRWWWIVGVLISPILVGIAYQVFRKWISKREILEERGKRSAKFGLAFFFTSLLCHLLSLLLTVISVITIGIGGIKSIVDDEPLLTVYDRYGNAYHDLYEVPLYDRQGNVYTESMEWEHLFITVYVDQNGNEYAGEYAYLDEEGYFYYDPDNKLTPTQNDGYYTDGEKLYYGLVFQIYWDENGDIYENSGRVHTKLFDLE